MWLCYFWQPLTYWCNGFEFYRTNNHVTLYDSTGNVLWQFDLVNYIDEPNFEIQDIRLAGDILYFNSACESYSKINNGECSALYTFDTKKEKNCMENRLFST